LIDPILYYAIDPPLTAAFKALHVPIRKRTGSVFRHYNGLYQHALYIQPSKPMNSYLVVTHLGFHVVLVGSDLQHDWFLIPGTLLHLTHVAVHTNQYGKIVKQYMLLQTTPHTRRDRIRRCPLRMH
jgi:hypothetical protein